MIRNIVLGVAVVATLLFFVMWRNADNQRKQLLWNQEVLLDSVHHYKVGDSLNAASVGLLEIELQDLKEFRTKDAQLIKELGLRLKRVEALSKTATCFKYEIKELPIKEPGLWEYKSQFLDFSARMQDAEEQKLSASIMVYDTLVQVLHRVPKFTFLGLKFGIKGVRQEIVNKNSYTHITASEYLVIEK